MKVFIVLTAFFFVLLLWVTPAQAYIDQASGSVLLQLILGGAAGALVVLRVFWHRFLKLFSKKQDQSEQPPDNI